MDLRSEQPFWPFKNGLLANYPPLKGDTRCEVAILGGGITGALVADYLTEAGMDVLLLDKRYVGWGSTAASTALLQYEIDVMLADLIDQIGAAHATRAYRLCLEAIGTLEALHESLGGGCDFQRKQSLYLASSAGDVEALRREFVVRRANGIPLAFLQAEEIEARYSFSAPAALLSDDAAQVDAYRMAHRLLARAVERGLRLYDRTEVVRFEATESGVTLETNREGVVRAEHVVFATGYESQDYLDEQVVVLHSSFALASEPLESFEGWADQCLIWESARPYFYGRTTADGRAIIGGEDEPFQNPTARDALIGRKQRTLVARFNQLFPKIPLEVAFAWAGTFGETKDGLAYIGSTAQHPRAHFALGYGGNGITFSLVAAELIRDALLGRDNPDAEIFRFGR